MIGILFNQSCTRPVVRCKTVANYELQAVGKCIVVHWGRTCGEHPEMFRVRDLLEQAKFGLNPEPSEHEQLIPSGQVQGCSQLRASGSGKCIVVHCGRTCGEHPEMFGVPDLLDEAKFGSNPEPSEPEQLIPTEDE